MEPFQKIISFAFAFSVVISCSKSEDASPQNSSAVTGTVNGKPFSATAEATDTGSGLYISLKDNTGQEIAFYVTGVIAGIYPFKDPTALDFKDQQHSVATIVSSNNLYLASGGSITISTGADGKLQGSYSLSNSQLGGTTSGTFQRLVIQALPSGQCLISTIKTYYRGIDPLLLYYDLNRRLVKMVWDGSNREAYFFFWQKDNVVQDVTIQYSGNHILGKWNYQNQLITKLTRTDFRDGSAYSISDMTYDLSGGIKEINVTYFDRSTLKKQYTYDGSRNVNQIIETIKNGGSTITNIEYSNYDNSNSPYSMIAKAVNAQFTPLPPFDDYDGIYFPPNKNNYQTIRYSRNPSISYQWNYQQSYNNSDFPTKLLPPNPPVPPNYETIPIYEIAYYGCK